MYILGFAVLLTSLLSIPLLLSFLSLLNPKALATLPIVIGFVVFPSGFTVDNTTFSGSITLA